MADENEDGNEFRQKFENTMDENRDLRLKVALMEAGVDTKTPMGSMFAEAVRSRGGELDSDALATEWAELGGAAPAAQQETPQAEPQLDPTLAALQPNQEPTVPGVSAEAMESLELSDQAADTSVPPAQRQDLTAHEAARLAKEEAREEGRDSTTQNAAYFGTLMSRAAAGDPTALWTPESWNEHLRDNGELPA